MAPPSFPQISKLARREEDPTLKGGGGSLRWAGGLLCRSGRGTSDVMASCSEHHGGLQKRSGFWVGKAKKQHKLVLKRNASDF